MVPDRLFDYLARLTAVTGGGVEGWLIGNRATDHNSEDSDYDLLVGDAENGGTTVRMGNL
jgi:hypothetical protein